jgi:hypothetical protein
MVPASSLGPTAATALLALLPAMLAQTAPADAKPKGQGAGICRCICASDATDPGSHLPKYTGSVSFTPGPNGCNSVLDNAGDCAVKDSGGHSVPGRLHSCDLSPGSSTIKHVPIGSVKIHPIDQ